MKVEVLFFFFFCNFVFLNIWMIFVAYIGSFMLKNRCISYLFGSFAYINGGFATYIFIHRDLTIIFSIIQNNIFPITRFLKVQYTEKHLSPPFLSI